MMQMIRYTPKQLSTLLFVTLFVLLMLTAINITNKEIKAHKTSGIYKFTKSYSYQSDLDIINLCNKNIADMEKKIVYETQLNDYINYSKCIENVKYQPILFLSEEDWINYISSKPFSSNLSYSIKDLVGDNIKKLEQITALKTTGFDEDKANNLLQDNLEQLKTISDTITHKFFVGEIFLYINAFMFNCVLIAIKCLFFLLCFAAFLIFFMLCFQLV